MLYKVFHTAGVQDQPLSYTELVQRVNNGEVLEATIDASQITGKLKEGKNYVTKLENEEVQRDLVNLMQEKGVQKIQFETSSNSVWVMTLITYAPFLLF